MPNLDDLKILTEDKEDKIKQTGIDPKNLWVADNANEIKNKHNALVDYATGFPTEEQIQEITDTVVEKLPGDIESRLTALENGLGKVNVLGETSFPNGSYVVVLGEIKPNCNYHIYGRFSDGPGIQQNMFDFIVPFVEEITIQHENFKTLVPFPKPGDTKTIIFIEISVQVGNDGMKLTFYVNDSSITDFIAFIYIEEKEVTTS